MRILCPLALTIGVLYAQTYTGSIRGRVGDPSGLPVADAAITVTEVNTNAVRSTATNSTGDYVVSFLKPGDYRIEVAAQGFKKATQGAMRLQLNQAMTADIALQLGDVTDRVEVAASAIQLNTVSPEI